MRTLAIGDIHGSRLALDFLLEAVGLRADDTVVTLGDYVDRGPDSRGVIDRLIELDVRRQLVPLRGNHELMMLAVREGTGGALRFWLTHGGVETLESYAPEGKGPSPEFIPEHHWHFLRHRLHDWYETDTHLFVHAGLAPDLPMDRQTTDHLHWGFLSRKSHTPHASGKTMVCGHTTQRSGLPLRLPGAVCIDTGAWQGDWLTCLDVASGQYWQANDFGQTRAGHLDDLPGP